jgi:molybdate transport system regulatory protein
VKGAGEKDKTEGGQQMKISARNMLSGKITEVKKGQVMAVIKLALSSGGIVTSIITNESADNLGLQAGKDATAIIKASSVMIGKGNADLQISARNIIKGKVKKIKEGMVMAEIALDMADGNTITATISDESVKWLALHENDEAFAIFKATSVMMGI